MGEILCKIGLGGIFFIALLTGCATSNTYPVASKALRTKASDIRIKPGDEIEIKFYLTPELNVTQTVRPGGKIQLHLLGAVQAAGKSPDELREVLIEGHKKYLEDPDMIVLIRNADSQRVFVGGMVTRPGVINIPTDTTAFGAILQAGGFQFPEAETKNIIVIRQDDEKRYGYSLNLKPALSEGIDVDPFYLQPEDIVFVPRTKITKVDQWITQHLSFIRTTGANIRKANGDTSFGFDVD